MGDCNHCGKTINNPGGLARHESACGERGAKKRYECEHCGSEFFDYPSRRETRGRKKFYCSKQCKDSDGREGKEVECAWCGESLYRPPAQLDSMGDYAIDNHFCDKECEKHFKRTNWVREGHPSWNGGEGGVNCVRNSLSEDVWFRVANRHRDQHCQNCGCAADERKHDVHHIVPIAAGGTNAPENLITLCISCHRKAEEYTRKFTEPHLLKPAL